MSAHEGSQIPPQEAPEIPMPEHEDMSEPEAAPAPVIEPTTARRARRARALPEETPLRRSTRISAVPRSESRVSRSVASSVEEPLPLVQEEEVIEEEIIQHVTPARPAAACTCFVCIRTHC